MFKKVVVDGRKGRDLLGGEVLGRVLERRWFWVRFWMVRMLLGESELDRRCFRFRDCESKFWRYRV